MVLTVCKSIGIAAVGVSLSKCVWSQPINTNPYTEFSPSFSTRIKNGNDINIFEDGKETRDFVYIDDVVNATILGLENEEANGQVYNVGTGEATDVLTVAQLLCKIMVQILILLFLGIIGQRYSS